MSIVSHEQIFTPQNKPKFLCLIFELAPASKDEVIFTVRDEKEGLISLKKLFVSHVVNDPTESEFAEAVFGNVGYWLTVRETKEIKPFVELWSKEADVIRKQKAFKAIMSEIEEGGRSAFTAAKFLIDEPWKDKRNPKVNKESKETTRKAAAEFSSDWERLKEQGIVQ